MVKHNANAVRWFGKKYKDLATDDKRALADHLDNMDKDKRAEYIKYLTGFCDYPLG